MQACKQLRDELAIAIPPSRHSTRKNMLNGGDGEKKMYSNMKGCTYADLDA